MAFAFGIGNGGPGLYVMRADGTDVRGLHPDYGALALNGLVWLP